MFRGRSGGVRLYMNQRSLILSSGVTVYAIAMWLAWYDERSTFGTDHAQWANHETASMALGLAGIISILLGALLFGLRVSNARRALGGAAMILFAIVIVSLWAHGINFLFLGPEIHGWSAGFLLIPVLLLASGGEWLLLAMGVALRHSWKRRAGA